MKKIALAFVIVLLIGAVAGCGAIQQQLSAPTGVVINGSRIQWNSVEGSSGYVILSGETEIVTTSNTSFDLSKLDLTEGQTYQISVKAKGDGYIKLGSEPSTTVSYTHTGSPSDSTQDKGGSNDTGSQNITPVSDVSVGNKLFGSGLGYGVNALTAKRAVGGVRLAEFFDNSLFTVDNIGSYDIGSSRSRAISKTSIRDEVIAINSKLVYGTTAEASLAGMFTAGFEEKFSLNTAVESELHVNQFYFILNMYLIGKNYQLTNYQQPRAYNNKISAEALEDIRDLNEGTLSPEVFFNRYGTHLVMAVSYGGMTEVNYASFSTETLEAVTIASALEAKLNAGFSYGIASANTSTEIGAELESTYHNNTQERINNLYIESIGKTPLTALTFDGFASEYRQWVSQMDNEDNYRIVDIADGGLVPIWSYIPNEYSNAIQRLKTYFETKATEKGVALANKMTPPIVEDNGDTVNYAGGHGTEEDPYLIATSAQLRNINIDLLNANEGKCYKLINDIDIRRTEWDPLGYTGSEYKAFKGTFDGNNHRIRGLTRTTAMSFNNKLILCGLFGEVINGKIKNVILENVNIDFSAQSVNDSYMLVGALAGRVSNAMITNCSAQGTIRNISGTNENYEHVGGLIGECKNTTIKFCANKVNIEASRVRVFAGGIVGVVTSDSSIKYSYNIGNFNVTSKWWTGGWSASVGGIVGMVNDGKTVTVEYCYSYSSIECQGGYYRDVGGIVATATSSNHNTTVRNNYYYTDTSFDKREIWNMNKKGNLLTANQFTSGTPIGVLHEYSQEAFESSEAYCWVYETNSKPKLYWE
ncbi:MAG: hypothetical protein IJ735_04460 [Clostridia bacterium]|nr:hypothetical protein [Clostridia bacterium]